MRVLTEVLDPAEFEKFSNRIVSKIFGVDIREYAEGKDGGIDGMDDSQNPTIIVQSKRFQQIREQSQIIKDAEKEIKKIKKTALDRGYGQFQYVFVTSCRLSANTIIKIREIAGKLMKNDINIVDGCQLEEFSLSSDYKKIFEKSGLISQDIINKLINDGKQRIENESKYYFDTFDSKYFVKTDAMFKAYDCLMDKHMVALTGNPGVGKTTNSRLISLIVASQQRTPFLVIERNVSDIPSVIDKYLEIYRSGEGGSLLVIFDDFLGRNSLEATSYELKNVNKICTMATNSPSLYIILNGRTQILNSAVNSNLEFKTFIDEGTANIVIVDVSKLTDIEKAQITRKNLELSYDRANSEEKSELENRYSDLREERNYLSIIGSKKWNPRLIRQISKHWNLSPLGTPFHEYVLSKINEPFSIYDELFKKLPEEAKYYLIELYLFNRYPVKCDIVRKSFIELKLSSTKGIDEIEKLLEQSWLTFSSFDLNAYSVDFVNPSIVDFFKIKCQTLSFMIDKIKKSCLYLGQISREFGNFELYNMIKNHYIDFKDQNLFVGERIQIILNCNEIDEIDEFRQLICVFSGNYFAEEETKLVRSKTWINILESIAKCEDDSYRGVFIKELFYGNHSQDMIDSLLSVEEIDDLLEILDDLLYEETDCHLEQNEFIDNGEEKTGVNIASEVMNEKTRRLQNELDDGTALELVEGASIFDKLNDEYDEYDIQSVVEEGLEYWKEDVNENLSYEKFYEGIDVEELEFDSLRESILEEAEDIISSMKIDDDGRIEMVTRTNDGLSVSQILDRPLSDRG